jgi:branched-chain amino acid transport system permease protein
MNPFATLVQLIVDGLAQGSLYAALALAIVLVNQATGLVNFAQGGMAVLGSYIGLAASNVAIPLIGLYPGIIVGMIIALAASFAIGALLERFVMRRFMESEPDTQVVVTIGLFTFLGGIIGLIWGFNYVPYPFFVSGAESFTIAGVSISVWSLTTFLAILTLMVLLQLLFRGTKLGLGLRAVADNSDSAALSGVKVGNMLMVGWGLAAALGTAAGVLLAAKAQLYPDNFDGILVYALAAVIIGGLDSPVGAVVAAWGIAIAESLAGVYVPFIGHDLKVIVPFLFLFLVLVFRPQGLFGRTQVVRV